MLAPSVGPCRSTACDNPPASSRAQDRATAQILVAFYVDEHARLGRSKPTGRQIGIVAQTVDEKLKRHAKPAHVREAIRKLVEKGNAPSHLASFVSEVEAKHLRSGPAHPSHVPFVPPKGPDPEEEEIPMPAAVKAARAPIGRAMP